jgi:hypothetical protein
MPDLHRDELHATLDRLTELHGNVRLSSVDYFNNGLACWLTDYNGEIVAEAAQSDAIHAEIGERLLFFSAEVYNSFPFLASTLRSQEARIAELERQAKESFDLGWKAAGGEIIPESEIAALASMNQQETK